MGTARTGALGVIILLTAILLGGGCTTKSLTDSTLAQNQPPGFDLPWSGSVRTVAAASDPSDCAGADFDNQILPPNRVSTSAEAAVFSPQWDPQGHPVLSDLAWAQYIIDFSSVDGPQQIIPEWDQAPAQGDCWIALANFEQRHWQWFAEKTPEMNDLTPYLDEARQMRVVVAVTGLDSVSLNRLLLYLPPFVVIDTTPAPPTGPAPLSVDFDASGSFSVSSTIASFEWDWTGDGAYELDSGTLATADHTYADPIECSFALRVTDARGVSRRKSVVIRAQGIQVEHPGAGAEPVQAEGVSISLVDGNPAIAYFNTTEHRLEYIRATDSFGNAWAAPVVVDADYRAGQTPSLNIVDGRPAIAYGHFDDYVLKYARALDATGATWGAPITVDSTYGCGIYSDLEIVDGYPAIGHFDYYDFDLRFVRATDAQGSSWGSSVIADNDGVQGEDLSLEVVGGFPAMSYWEKLPQDLNFVRALDAHGDTWGSPQTLDGLNDLDVGAETSLCLLPGGPAVSYFDLDNNDLKFVAATASDGSSWGSPVTLDADSLRGERSCLMMISGLPQIAYRSYYGDLFLICAVDVGCSSWDVPEHLLDPEGIVYDTDLDMCEVMDQPGIALTVVRDLTYVRTVR